MVIVLVICVTILIIVLACINHDKERPQYKCNHDMDTMQTWSSGNSTQYLSTCKKCGYQDTHIFTPYVSHY